MNNEIQHTIELIRQIAKRSMKGEINWTQPNPSTFQWIHESDGSTLVVSIQRAINITNAMRVLGLTPPESTADYLFQIQESSPKRVVVSLSSKERPQLATPLEELYSSAERGIDQRTNKVIQRLLTP